jgi:hypothetical protein
LPSTSTVPLRLYASKVRAESFYSCYISLFRQITLPYEDIVTVKTSRSARLAAKAAANEKPRRGFRFWRSRVSRGEEPVNKFGFLGNVADTLDIYYVPDASRSNKFTLEKVG